MQATVPVIRSKEKWSPLVPHSVTSVSSTSTPALAVLGNSAACETRVEQLELEFLMALDSLSITQDSDDDSEENVTDSDELHLNGTLRVEELQSRYRLVREKYKTELWNRDFEPVLQRVRLVAAATSNAEMEESAKSATVRRLVASGCILQKERDVLDGLLGECTRIGNILGEVGHFLGTPSTAGEQCGSWSDNLYGRHEDPEMTATTQDQEQGEEESMTCNLQAKLLATSFKPNSEDDVNFRTYYDHIFASLQNLQIQAKGDTPTTLQTDNNTAPPTIFVPFMTTQLYATVTERIAVAKLRAENAALSAAMHCERKQFNATFDEVQCRNEEDLSLAAELLIEAVQVQAQMERVRAVTEADLGVSTKIRDEIVRSKDVD